MAQVTPSSINARPAISKSGGGKGIMGGVMGLLKGLAKTVRGVGSLLAGIPLAVAGTVIGGITLLIIEGAAALNAKTLKSFFGTELVEDAQLKKAKEDIKSLIGSLWTSFGIYPYLKAAEYIQEVSEDILDSAGSGTAQDNMENRNELSQDERISAEKMDKLSLMQDTEILGSSLKELGEDSPLFSRLLGAVNNLQSKLKSPALQQTQVGKASLAQELEVLSNNSKKNEEILAPILGSNEEIAKRIDNTPTKSPKAKLPAVAIGSQQTVPLPS